MVTRWGMHPQVGVLVQADRQNEDLGGLLAAKETSEFMHQKIDEAMQAIVNERLAFTRKLMADNRDKLERLAELLLEHESADAAQIREALNLPEQPPATTDDARVMMPA
jgi:cell division protease FtsH